MAEFVYRYCQLCHAELKTREQVRGFCAECRRKLPGVRICAHADDGSGAHLLREGETCDRKVR